MYSALDMPFFGGRADDVVVVVVVEVVVDNDGDEDVVVAVVDLAVEFEFEFDDDDEEGDDDDEDDCVVVDGSDGGGRLALEDAHLRNAARRLVDNDKRLTMFISSLLLLLLLSAQGLDVRNMFNSLETFVMVRANTHT